MTTTLDPVRTPAEPDAAGTSGAPSGPSPLALSVLDRGGHAPGVGGEAALRDVVEAAILADAHGFHRFWVPEHHASAQTASSCPAVLVAHLAARTTHLRVGSGGVMLPNHPPCTVAGQFATLQALHPGRIDLGLGRSAPARSPAQRLLEAALHRDPQAIGEFPAQIDELLELFLQHGSGRHRLHGPKPTPHTAGAPQVHILGGSEGSARIAAERGLAFTYGHHLSRATSDPEAAARYRSAFVSGPDGASPYLIVAVNVLCAETDELAEESAIRTAARRIGQPDGTAPTAAARQSPARSTHLARRALEEYRVVYGGPGKVAAELEQLAAELAADEIMLSPYELTGAERRRTLRLAAGIRPLRPRRTAAR